MIDAIVAIITLATAGVVLFWIVRPSVRSWIEKPKYTMLEDAEKLQETEIRQYEHSVH
jgi:hypothetical protein